MVGSVERHARVAPHAAEIVRERPVRGAHPIAGNVPAGARSRRGVGMTAASPARSPFPDATHAACRPDP
jgi:hypothetical protein